MRLGVMPNLFCLLLAILLLGLTKSKFIFFQLYLLCTNILKCLEILQEFPFFSILSF